MSALLTTNELAAKLNVHRITVLRMANKGTIPYIAIGKTEQPTKLMLKLKRKLLQNLRLRLNAKLKLKS